MSRSASRVELTAVTPETRDGASPAAAGATWIAPHHASIASAVQNLNVRGKLRMQSSWTGVTFRPRRSVAGREGPAQHRLECTAWLRRGAELEPTAFRARSRRARRSG